MSEIALNTSIWKYEVNSDKQFFISGAKPEPELASGKNCLGAKAAPKSWTYRAEIILCGSGPHFFPFLGSDSNSFIN